ncbi:MAG: UDP-N-acetylmuramoyl-L-alanyl-D-glutamate--2,6-diaminopimelate ligase [bacterium]
MNISKLLEGVEISDLLNFNRGIEITGINSNSKYIKPGEVFVALRGERFDGHNFIEEAIDNGAVLVIGDKRMVSLRVPYVEVPNSKVAYGIVCRNFYNNPFRDIRTIGITGTNGKGTVAHIIGNILKGLGEDIGLIGTIEVRLKDEVLPSYFTTPEQLILTGLFSRARERGIRKIVMEVSSHSLVQHRVDAVCFDGAIFTNLTQDHLDFHNDMESYFRAKRMLFEKVARYGRDRLMVINIDDEYGKRLVEDFSRVNPITYGIREKASLIRAEDMRFGPEKTYFNLVIEGKCFPVEMKLLGEINVYNALGALGYIYGEGLSIERSIEILSSIPPVKGRMERIDIGQPFTVILDYAHTPDALERILVTAKMMGKRLIVVFGCGGDRDKGKRPIMGKIATMLADLAIITSDNPRSEDPKDIIRDILNGVKGNNYKVFEDRKEAIFFAIDSADEKDIVVIAGKGHETYQIFKDGTIYFDDREVALEAIKERISNAC